MKRDHEGVQFVGEYVRVPAHSAFALTEFTIEAWINPTAGCIGANYSTIVARGSLVPDSVNGDLNHSAWWLGLYYGRPRFSTCHRKKNANPPEKAEDFALMEPFPETPALPIDWTHLAVTYEGGKKSLYINGEKVSTFDEVANNEAPANPLYYEDDVPVTIGAKLAPGGTAQPSGVAQSHFYGLIDDPTIYNRALGKEEIGKIVRARCAGKRWWVPNMIPTPFPGEQGQQQP